MIVRPATRALHLITQPDHAALAAGIMEHWVPLQDAERRASILLAIQEHDNGWREPDEAPSVDPTSGRIYDFISAPAPVRQAVWPRGVARLSHDPWAAALVAQHALTVYDRYRSDESWHGFFAEMEAARDALLSSTRLPLEQLAHDYSYVRVGDLISLVFCNRWLEEQTFASWTFQLRGERVMARPDAFGGRDIPIVVIAREIPDRVYASDEELRSVVFAAPAVTLHGVVGA